MKYKHNKKKYFFVSVYKTGKIEVDEANATNFHPSYINEIRYCIGNTNDYAFTACEEKNIEKTKLKLLKGFMKGLIKEINTLQKEYDAYNKAYKILTQN